MGRSLTMRPTSINQQTPVTGARNGSNVATRIELKLAYAPPDGFHCQTRNRLQNSKDRSYIAPLIYRFRLVTFYTSLRDQARRTITLICSSLNGISNRNKLSQLSIRHTIFYSSSWPITRARFLIAIKRPSVFTPNEEILDFSYMR